MASRFKLEARQVNDSLYELYKPDGDPGTQILFFHGLAFGKCSEVHLSTWISGDGSCIWPKVWLAKEFPNAHILVVSYNEGLKQGSAESFDIPESSQIIRENLISDLIQANVGQNANCPVVLVGHSFGGLVIKDMCLDLHSMLVSSPDPATDKAKVQKFLDNLRGVFYYSTPHRGSKDIRRAAGVLSGPLLEYFTVLGFGCSRLNYLFNLLCNSDCNLKIGGLGEGLPVKWGIFQGIVIVPEESATDRREFDVDSSADHFSVCRPENTTSTRFKALTRLLRWIYNDLKDKNAIQASSSTGYGTSPEANDQ